MSNFSKIFYDCIAHSDIEGKDQRVQRNMIELGLGAADAMALDNALLAASRTAMRVVGAKIDTLPPHVQPTALRMLLGSVSANMMIAQHLTSVMLDDIPLEFIGEKTEQPPGVCDCQACVTKRALRAEISQLREYDR